MGTAIDMAFDGATLAACPLSALVLSFAFYGFCGWAWESTVCAMLNHGRFANSGFLLGPCCPIYGAGGIACWLLLRGISDASSQFVAAALVCSVIEYSVGLLLEKTTGARFWDYSHLPFNLHGRICLYWACAFGLGALCICRLVEPALLGLLGHLPVLIVRLSAFIVSVAMMVDAVCSLASWRRLSDQLERVRADLADRINESLADASDSMLERIPDSTIDSVAQTHIRSRAVNAWLAELGDAALDALREKLRCRRLSRMVLAAWRLPPAAWPMLRRACRVRRSPVSVPAGAQAVRCRVCRSAVATCAFSMPSRVCASIATKVSFEQLISATAPTSCFGASRDGHAHGSLARVFPVRFAPVAVPFPRLRHRFHSTTQRLTTPYLVYTSCPSAALWAPTTFMRPKGSECTIRDRQRLCSSAPCSCF